MRYLLLSLNVTFIWVSVLGIHFVIVCDQNTSCKILLELLNCYKTFQKIMYLSVTSHVVSFFSLSSPMCLRQENVEWRHNLEIMRNWWNCDIARWQTKTHFWDKYSDQIARLLLCSKKDYNLDFAVWRFTRIGEKCIK